MCLRAKGACTDLSVLRGQRHDWGRHAVDPSCVTCRRASCQPTRQPAWLTGPVLKPPAGKVGDQCRTPIHVRIHVRMQQRPAASRCMVVAVVVSRRWFQRWQQGWLVCVVAAAGRTLEASDLHYRCRWSNVVIITKVTAGPTLEASGLHYGGR